MAAFLFYIISKSLGDMVPSWLSLFLVHKRKREEIKVRKINERESKKGDVSLFLSDRRK